MAQKVDELQLQISSDASSAIASLENLARNLESASASAKSFVNSANSLKALANGLNKIAGVNFNSAISGLTRLSKIDLSNLKDKKVDITLSVSGADQAERLVYATQDAEKNVLKSASKISKAFGQKYNVDNEGITEMTSQVKELITALSTKNGGAAGESIENIFKIIAERGRLSLAELQGVKNEFLKEYEELRGIVVGTSGLSSSEIESLFGKGFGANLKKGATSIDANWEEIIGENKQSLDSFGNSADTVGDQVQALADRLDYLRTMLTPREITDGDILDGIGFDVNHLMEDIDAKLKENVAKNMRESAAKIPIDLDVDQKRFEAQIQRAINLATDGRTYKAKPIQVEIDAQQLKQNIEHAFSLVDITKLPEYAGNFERMSQAISAMNQTKLKDTGVTQFANAFRKLVGVDTSNFDPSLFHKVATGINEFKNVGEISSGVTKFVSAIARLANAGDNTRKTAYGLDALVPRLRSAVRSFADMGAIDSSISKFISSFTRLATSGGKAKETAENLRGLTKEVILFLKAMQHAPQVSDNLAMTIQGLGNLAAAGQKTGKALSDVSSLGNSSNGVFSNSFSVAAQSVTSSLKGLLNVSLQLGGKGASSLGHFMQRLGLLPGASNGIDRTAITFTNLLRAIIPFYGIRGIFDWAKQSFEAGSSIVELRNVIDTAFGSVINGYRDISGYIYKWSQGTIDAFGISEIAAQRYAGRLMSMFNSSGFDATEGMRDSAAKMTTELIERAGDIASFYEITVDEAMTKMQAAMAGMSRPMRALGVNMNVANLEAFALEHGINQSWQSMNQATQMAVRYAYMLEKTRYAEWDFAATSMSASNQAKLLSVNIGQLSATFGQGLVPAIAPVLSWLNALIKRLIQAANAFRIFMFTLFGKPLAAAKGMLDETAGYLDDAAGAMSDLGSGAGGASDGLGSAGKAAKELKKQLTVLPFDELNQLAKDTESAGSGGSGGGGGGGGVGGLGGLDTDGLLPDYESAFEDSPVVQAIDRWAARIREAFEKHQWKNLGRIVAEGINAGFGYIYEVLDYNKIKPKIVDGFIHPFQDAFNSMMTFIDWKLVGRTFARGLNDVVYILREWITGFEWRNYGTYFAEGLNAVVDGWDANAFGRLIADKFKMAWDFFGGFVETFDFTELGGKLKSGLLGFLDELDFSDMGKSLAGFANGIADTLIEMLEDKEVRDELASSFSDFVNSFLEEFDEEDASYALQLVGDTIFGGLAKAIGETDKSEFVYKLATVLSSLPWGSIALIIGAKAGASLAAGIFGHWFKQKAISIISGLFPNLSLGATGGASGAASAATSGASGAASSGLLSGLSTLSVGTIAVGGSIMFGALALGTWLNKWTQEHGGVEQFHGQNLAPSHQQSNQPQQPQTKQNAAGYSTQIQTVKLKGETDSSYKELIAEKLKLHKDPVVTKTLKGKEDDTYKVMAKDYLSVATTSATKTALGTIASTFRTTKTEYNSIGTTTITKTGSGAIASAFNTMKNVYNGVYSNTATKTANGVRTGAFNTAWDMFTDLKDKWVTAHLDIETNATQVVAGIANGAGGVTRQVLADIWTEYHAKGGLFTSPMGFQVFGEAGAEAAIPLERKSTMKRIASAIVDSGGMATGSSSELADEIALRIAPIVMSAVTGQNERPINVNATLYTENNEVLARAVNQGNRILDKRYNPVAQFSY